MPRTGRPKSESPKNIQIKIVADKQFTSDLEYCATKLNITKSDVIRLGVERVKADLENKK